MKVKSPDVPGAHRDVCNRCRKPVILAWRGRDGIYCSNTCLVLAEEQDLHKEKIMSDESEATATAAATDESVSGTKGKRSKKASKPSAKAKKESGKSTKKKAAGKAGKPKATRKSSFGADQVIKLLKKDNPFRGSRGKRHGLIKSGMTVGQYHDALVKAKNFGRPMGSTVSRTLKRAVAAKLISLK